MRNQIRGGLVCLAILAQVPFSRPATAQDGEHLHHEMMTHHGGSAKAPDKPAETGQAAFAAIAEIVSLLKTDPETEWSRVDIEALRQHLIDMDNVTLRAQISAGDIEGGALFTVTSDDPDVQLSIRRMVIAHAATMDGVDGLAMKGEEIAKGARLQVTGETPDMIRALGFIGLMTSGMHHQAHHLAIARGQKPHGH